MKLILYIIFITATLFSEPITPIPLSVDVDDKKVQLGKKLFFDTILSKNNTVSCATCHDLLKGGDDGLKFSFGIDGKIGNINSPTVYNAVYNFRQFWNGRSEDLAHQALDPIENPVEMGNSISSLIKTLSQTQYKQKFQNIYKDGITKDNIADAIAEFEKTLITPNAPIDKYLRGDENALSTKQKRGYELFKSKGCIACHHGINVGSNLYNKFGVMSDVESKSLGRYEVTKKEADKYYFKVPTLRNIEHTAPYLHDGRYTKLEDVVKFMARYQLGRMISDDDISAIVEFLISLTGEIPQTAKR